MTTTAVISARRPPREYVIPRHVSRTNSAPSAAQRTAGERATSVVSRSAIGTASTHTSAERVPVLQRLAQARRERRVVEAHAEELDARDDLAAERVQRARDARRRASRSRRARSAAARSMPTAIASTTTSAYATPRLTCAHVRSGATDHSSVIPHQTAKPSEQADADPRLGRRAQRQRAREQPADRRRRSATSAIADLQPRLLGQPDAAVREDGVRARRHERDEERGARSRDRAAGRAHAHARGDPCAGGGRDGHGRGPSMLA